jgi:catechol 2,3-dioxygenase-like lactoylglutathione lyase family enzyme
MSHLKKGVAYIVIGVSELARSVAFYRDTLGLPLQFEQGGLAFLTAGPVMLMLSADLGRARSPIPGAMEIVFSVEAVKPAWRALAAEGVPFFREPRQVTDKEWSAVLQDPDGDFLTLFGPPGE